MINIEEVKKIVDKHKNVLVKQVLVGSNLTHIKCTCGYEYIQEIENYCDTPSCSNCNTYNKKNINELYFGNRESTAKKIIVDAISYYKVCITCYKYNISTNINFNEQRLKDINVMYEEIFTLCIDFVDKEYKAFNMLTGEKITITAFKQKYYKNTNLSFANKKQYNNFFYDFSIDNKISLITKKYISDLSDKLSLKETYVEILSKAGYVDISSYHIENKMGTTPGSILNLSKFSLKMLKEKEININIVKMIEQLYKNNIVDFYNKFNKYITSMTLNSIKYIYKLNTDYNISLKKLSNYLNNCFYKQFLYSNSVNDIINEIYDVFVMRKTLGYITKELPSDLITEHDLLTRKISIQEDKNKDKMYREYIYKDNIYLEFNNKNSKYKVILPKNLKEIIKEGEEMHHCVGTYIDRILKRNSKILFIRNKEDVSDRATLELDQNDNMVQIKSKYNNSPSKELLNFYNEWITSIG